MSHPPDDDRTVLSTAGVQSPPAEPAQGPAHTLPAGTRLGEFEIAQVLGEGGFGIVYLANDHSLERQVALKEYMPSFAVRATQAHVSVRSIDKADSFEAGRRSFINEARMLAQFDHPSLVKVYRFWEANGTAYMVMPYYRGPTLKQALRERGAPPDEAWLRALLAPLLDALEVIHQHQCFHRDIAPDNILMLDEGRPLLLDFGAARRAIGGMDQAFTVILKQNYAPIEQYAEMPGMSQGPWTDLYALASVVHFAIAGSAPPQAVSRMLLDPYVPLATRYAGRFSPAFLEAIDRALAFKPTARPQSVAAMRSLLGIDAAPARERTEARPAPAAPVAPSNPRAEHGGRRKLLAAGAGAVLLAGAGLLVYLNGERRANVMAPVAAGPAARPVAAGPAPLPAAAPAFDPVAALDAIVAGASVDRKVTARVDTPRVRIGSKGIDFSVRSTHPGYVYVYMVSTDRKEFFLLFPNLLDKNHHIDAGETIRLPREKWKFDAYGPPGTDHFVVMVSEGPRDFRSAGLTGSDQFAVFPLARAAKLQDSYSGATPLFAGVPACASTPCPAAYGAAAFTIDEMDK